MAQNAKLDGSPQILTCKYVFIFFVKGPAAKAIISVVLK